MYNDSSNYYQIIVATYRSSITGTSSPRIGRREIFSNVDKRYYFTNQAGSLYHIIKTEDIRKLLGMPISTRTVARMLKESGYGHWRAQKRPQLTEELAKLCHE